MADMQPARVADGIRKLGLGVKVGAFAALVTAAVITLSFIALNVAVRNDIRRRAAATISSEQRILIELQNRHLLQLLSTSSLITQSPTLRAAIDTYRMEARSGSSRPELLTTIEREISKVVTGLGKDLLIVTDERGSVLASSEGLATVFTPGADLSQLPAVVRALNANTEVDRANFAVLRVGQASFHVGIVPVVLGGYIIGTIGVGDRIDDQFVADLRESFDGDVAITAGSTVLLSTLEAVRSDAPASTALTNPRTEGTRPIYLAGEEFVTAPLSLGRDHAGRQVTLHLLSSLSKAMEPVSADLRRSALLYGLLAIAFATLGASWIARSVLGPLNRFVHFVRSVAETGDFSQRFTGRYSTPEVATLNDSYNYLIGSLAREHKKLEQRTAELSAANEILTEQIAERERVETELERSEEQLRQSQKLEAIGTLAGGVAHDFNNLLTVISSYCDFAMESAKHDEELLEDIRQVKLAGQRASSLTQQLLAFSRKQVLRPKILDLNNVVEGVEKMLRRLIGEDINLQTTLDRELPKVKADPGQIEQIIVNLAVNARDAMPRGGALTIETSVAQIDQAYVSRKPVARPGSYVMVSISDSGTGMDTPTLERIFEPFFTTKAAGKGTGLGLSTVYGIVKQSGGFIWVYSEVGLGTTFKIYLPLVDENSESTTREVTPVNLTGTETILMVEDDGFVRSLAQKCLERFGYRVLSAPSGIEALEILQDDPVSIDLLLTDVVMPGMSGRELALRIRPMHPNARVLYMSGYTDEAVVNHGVVEPGTHFLQKPFNPMELGKKVREVLEVGAETDHVAV